MALTPKQRKAALEKGLSVDLAAADNKQYLNPNPVAATQLFARYVKANHRTSTLPADGRPVDTQKLNDSTIPLAPLQWAIWEALNEADSLKKLVTYRKLAQVTNASIRGVRDALAVIEKEGGVLSKITVRTPDEQGMRIELNTLKPFRLASLKETKGLLKRGDNYRQTVD